MATALAEFIQHETLVDTHEHLAAEADWVSRPPDILMDLFDNYVWADLISAGASKAAIERARDSSDQDIAGRFAGIQAAWEAVKFTGYGEAVRILGREVHGLKEINVEGLLAAQGQMAALHQPGERFRLLHDEARLDHVQIDNFCWECMPDPAGKEFFLYDLNWQEFCRGMVPIEAIHRETGIEVRKLGDLREAQRLIFEKYGPIAIAVKTQHAYGRTLDWHPRSETEAQDALDAILRNPEQPSQEDQLCLGDWSWAHGVELAIEHNLPFKIHTGYYAGNNYMPVDRIRSGHLYRLLQRYPEARFVLMHIAYPYSQELIAMAKHYSNVWVDLCWAWSIDPFSAGEFVRRFLHTVPINKLFAFGGDTSRPTSSLAYALQARRGLLRALEAECDAGELSEPEAIRVAARLMSENAGACFDLAGTRDAINKLGEHSQPGSGFGGP